MSAPEYEPIPHEVEDSLNVDDSPINGKYPPQYIRPPTYYGEGEFDPPSSDEEESFLEKSKPRPTDDTENVAGSLDDDGELIVGGKVCDVPISNVGSLLSVM